MPALVNYSGPVDVCCPPRKRSRISLPVVSTESKFEEDLRPSFDNLPDECLFEILRRLRGDQERSCSALVSKRWLKTLCGIYKADMVHETRTISGEEQEFESDGHLTRNLEGKRATDIRLAAIAIGTGSCGGLGKLSIWGSNSTCGPTNFGLSAIAHGCPSLRTLSLSNVSSIGDEGLIELANGCHMLEKLDLQHCPSISDRGLIAIAKRCPNLKSLNIESCVTIGNEGIQAIGKFCPKLHSISIKNCPGVEDKGVATLLAYATSSLTTVKLQSLGITDQSLGYIGYFGKAVTNLTLSSLRKVSGMGFRAMSCLQGLQKLVSLKITSCSGLTDLNLESMGNFPNLKQMSIAKCCFLSDKGLVDFTRAARSLESLQLSECNRITLSGIIDALLYCGSKLESLTVVNCMGVKDAPLGVPMNFCCRSLRSLSIRNCREFGDESLAMLGILCPGLQNVDLSDLFGVTAAGLLPLLQNTDGLVNVNLNGCVNLTDEVVIAITMLHGGTLEVLSLEGCSKITDASLMEIANNCLVLSDLHLSKCAVTDLGIAALSCEQQIKLGILSLAGCVGVSNNSVHFLLKMEETLTGLNLQRCNSISRSKIDELKDKLWRCDILS